jgi:hypothetical protein
MDFVSIMATFTRKFRNLLQELSNAPEVHAGTTGGDKLGGQASLATDAVTDIALKNNTLGL